MKENRQEQKKIQSKTRSIEKVLRENNYSSASVHNC